MLIGIVTVDDVLDIAEGAATREMQRSADPKPSTSPTCRSPGRMVRKRAGWLVVLFLGEMLTATAMGFFEKEIARAVVLALFVPLIISSGGNSGSQASTLVIRAMAIGELHAGTGGRLSAARRCPALHWAAFSDPSDFCGSLSGRFFPTSMGRTGCWWPSPSGFALVGVVLWGHWSARCCRSCSAAGFDPATSSAPFVATLVDVTGLVIYFSVGMVVLRGTLL